MQVLGIDIGGTGIKGAPVDVPTGTLLAERVKLPTPQPAQPDAVAEVVQSLVAAFGWTGPAGVTFPGVVIDGVTHTAANLGKSWLGRDARSLFAKATGLPVTLLNDADAAGVAEMRFGAGAGQRGTVLMLTLGTGIGSALFTDGVLVPNTEFGHIEIRGKDAEERASERARIEHDWTWDAWARRVEEYLRHMEALLSPSLIIVGGGVSRKADKFLPSVQTARARVTPAVLHNDAGLVGAAMAAAATRRSRAAQPAGRTPGGRVSGPADR
ncbi:MAG: ROK family protein, partial [Actinobacteria bacterium]|nr:ROK family protein [Actinomycetota bacterium]